MARFDYDLVVIGGGAAGLTAASGASQLGAGTLLIEREEEMGGDCLHYGCVPSKALIKSASVYWQMKNASRYGLPQVDVPPVGFAAIAGRIEQVIAALRHHDSKERFEGLGVKLLRAEPCFIDEHLLDCGERKISARKIVIATGSRAAAPGLNAESASLCITNRQLFSLPALPEHLIILGGGAVAVEMAQAFNRLGAKVTVIQRGRQILSREDRDMADSLLAILQREGVDFHLGVQVKRIEKAEAGRRVIVCGADGEMVVTGDTVLLAQGRRANIEGLGLDGIGVNCDEKGIRVDKRMRTARAHIFAAGDVTGRFQYTHAAGYEGGIVVANAIFKLPRKADYRWMPHCTYTAPGLASVGLNECEARARGEEYSCEVEPFADNDRAVTEGEAEGKIKLILNRGGKPLGVQVLGPCAGDILAEWIMAFSARAGLSTMAGAVHPYPTFSEINKKVAGRRLSRKLFSERTRKVLSLLFGYGR